MNYNLIIITLTVLCIVVLVALLRKREKIENFQSASNVCNFSVGENLTKDECLASCINYAAESSSDTERSTCLSSVDESGCIRKCEENTNNPCLLTGPGGNEITKCMINNHTDISGNTLEQCVDRCARPETTCDGCRNFNVYDSNTGVIVSGSYTHSIKDFEEKCTPDPYKHLYCSPCVEACKACVDPGRCRWKADSDAEKEARQQFQNTEFKIGVLPDDKSALIVWNEVRNDVDKYYIYIYKKSDINLSNPTDGTKSLQQTPLTVKTIKKPFEKTGNNSHLITGLTNGETYTITVNKISTHSQPQLVKVSNTIEVVPSTVKLVDFSKLSKDNSLKQKELLSVGFFNQLRGKTIDLSI